MRLLQQGHFDRALHIFQLLAAKGDDVATSNLGFMYQHGLGVPVDYDKAHELYWQAASHGVPVAANQMGYLYQYGLGVPQNLTTAYCWYEFAGGERLRGGPGCATLANSAFKAWPSSPAPPNAKSSIIPKPRQASIGPTEP